MNVQLFMLQCTKVSQKDVFMTKSRLLFIAAIVFVIAAILSFVASMTVNRGFLAIAIIDMLAATVLMIASRRQRA